MRVHSNVSDVGEGAHLEIICSDAAVITHGGEDATLMEEVGRSVEFCYATFVHDQDFVECKDGAQPVGDTENSLVLEFTSDSVLNLRICFEIDRASRFIEDYDLRLSERNQ